MRLIEEKDQPRADVIIGVDNILIFEAIDNDVLEPYTPSNLSLIRQDLVEFLDPQHYVVPYDYGLIALVYDTNFINSTAYPQIESLTFEDLLEDSYAKTMVTEDPTQSSTGLSFLLWQIAIYTKVYGRDWSSWWAEIKDRIHVAKSWGDAYSIFLNEAAGRHIVVSYGTDPAYSYYFYNSTRYNATLLVANGSYYGWLQIEGIGIVRNAPHRELAEKFIEWFLSNEVQAEIPLNNWMYPANKNVELPEVYKYAIDPYSCKLANDLLSREEIKAHLSEWLYTWTEIMTIHYPIEAIIIGLSALGVAIIATVIIIVFKKKKGKRNHKCFIFHIFLQALISRLLNILPRVC